MTRRGAFCFVCGKVTEDLIKGRCRECYYREAEPLRIPKEPKARVCRECLSYFKAGRWHPQDRPPDEAVRGAAIRALRDSMVLKDAERGEVEISLGNAERPDDKRLFIPFSAAFRGMLRGDGYSAEKSGRVEVVLGICDSCAKRKSRYYEAVIQIRGAVQDMGDVRAEAVGYLEGRRVKDPGAFISDIKPGKKGVDIYVGSLSAGRKAAHHLAGKYGGEVRESPKLMGRGRDGRDLYRVSISLRLPRFMRDDILRHRGRMLQVMAFRGSRVVAYDLDSRQRCALTLKSLNKAEILGRRTDVKMARVSEVTPSHVQVIEEKNNATAYFDLVPSLRVGEKVRVFHNGKDYLLMTEEELR